MLFSKAALTIDDFIFNIFSFQIKSLNMFAWRFYVKYYCEKRNCSVPWQMFIKLHFFFYFHQLRILQLGTAMPHTEGNHTHCHHIPLRRKFYCFFLRTLTLGNRLPKRCFPDHYNLNPFKSRVNCYLSYIYSLSLWLWSTHLTHISTRDLPPPDTNTMPTETLHSYPLY